METHYRLADGRWAIEEGGHHRLASYSEETPALTRARRASVYLVEGGGLFKIGYSSNPSKRLRSFQCGSPVRLHLVLEIPLPIDDAVSLERELHARFSAKHSHGEWFRLTPADLSTLARSGA